MSYSLLDTTGHLTQGGYVVPNIFYPGLGFIEGMTMELCPDYLPNLLGATYSSQVNIYLAYG